MTSIPHTMRSLVAPKWCKPDEYEVIELPVPEIQQPDEVLVKVYVSSIQTGDTMAAKGSTNFLSKPPLPLKLGVQGGGAVVAVGSGVKDLRPGDEVYGMHVAHPILPWSIVGYCSEYVVTKESYLLRKPSHLSIEEAVSLLASTMTAYQGIRLGMSLMPGSGSDKLEGKTVFVPAALGSTGFVALQMLKKVYGAGKVISTVSTPKVPLVAKLLPGVVDQVIDYKTQDIVKEVGRGKVDFIYNTMWNLNSLYPILNPKTGVVLAIAGVVPKSTVLRSALGDALPFWLAWSCDLAQLYYKWKLWGTNIKQEFVSGNPGVREDMEAAGEIIASGKLKAVMTVVNLSDLEAVRRECAKIESMKGAVGKLIIRMV
ncbi:GroES-like protein [Coniochaeta ligniaria NRRL 30616]|uniref:GroES-like protein n=1 Tax=Coniochaeta ligniaria NRRL 30616 TaxID=1408157 RepID=A0A1J7IL39_9PEZI|nr:GroES-like protein [Coniochaeta ligniaria NRRL 30616]